MDTPWYEENFSTDYLELYAHRDQDEGFDDIAKAALLADIEVEDSILDLCCGAGRHLRALHTLGFEKLTGLDLSRDLLKKTQKNLLEDEIVAILIQADMREIPEELAFNCILSLFTSFGYFKADADNASVLSGAYERLLPNGVMLMDTINPLYLAQHLVPSENKKSTNRTMSIERVISKGAQPRIEKTTCIEYDDREKRTYFESVRLFSADDFTTMYTNAGFSTVEIFGSLEGHPYDENAPRLVIRALK